MKQLLFLLLPAGIMGPAAAQQNTWRVSAEAGVSVVGVGNAKALPAGKSLNNGYTDVNPTLLLRVSRQSDAAGKWRVGIRAELASWQVNKGVARVNAQGVFVGEGPTYLGWPAISLAPMLYRRLAAGRNEMGLAVYGGIAWGSGRKPVHFYAPGYSQYFSASTGFQAGAELQYRYRISGSFSIAASAGMQRSWMTLVDNSNAGFRLNCVPVTLGLMYSL